MEQNSTEQSGTLWRVLRCPKCKKSPLNVDIEVLGGCTGHDEGEYCYCAPAGCALELYCPKCYGFREKVLEDAYEVERLIRNYLTEGGWKYLAKRLRERL